MFEPTSLLLFMTASLALNLAPGPDMLYVSTRSLRWLTASVFVGCGLRPAPGERR